MQTKQPVLEWCRRLRTPDSTASVFAWDKCKVRSVRLRNRSPAADVSQWVCIVLQRNKGAKHHDDTTERNSSRHEPVERSEKLSLAKCKLKTIYCQNNNSTQHNRNKNRIFSWPSFILNLLRIIKRSEQNI